MWVAWPADSGVYAEMIRRRKICIETNINACLFCICTNQRSFRKVTYINNVDICVQETWRSFIVYGFQVGKLQAGADLLG